MQINNDKPIMIHYLLKTLIFKYRTFVKSDEVPFLGPTQTINFLLLN